MGLGAVSFGLIACRDRAEFWICGCWEILLLVLGSGSYLVEALVINN